MDNIKFKTMFSKIEVRPEYYEPGTSETEEGQEVSIHSVYERCLRGEMVPNVSGGVYEKQIGFLEHPDSDLADITEAADYLASTVSSDKTEPKSQDGAAPYIASSGQENFGDGAVKDSPEAK